MPIVNSDTLPRDTKPPIPMPADITFGVKYGYAMTIADQAEADAYFEACVEHTMRWGKSRAEAEATEHSNLGYFAGYYAFEVRERVERLFGGVHPIFGSTGNEPMTDEQVFEIGKALGEAARKKEKGLPMLNIGDTVVVLDKGLYRGLVCRIVSTREFTDGTGYDVAALSDKDNDPETRTFPAEYLTTDLIAALAALQRDRDELAHALVAIRGSQRYDVETKSWGRIGAETIEEAIAIADKVLRAERPVGIQEA